MRATCQSSLSLAHMEPYHHNPLHSVSTQVQSTRTLNLRTHKKVSKQTSNQCKQDSSVTVVTRLRAGRSRMRGSIPSICNTFFHFLTVHRPALKATQPTIQRVPGYIPRG
jgi:hypothetical protein